MAKEVAKKTENALMDASAFDQFAGAGTDDFGANDIIIPLISVINALSDEKKRSSSKYIEGAEDGDLVDTGVGEILAKQDGSFTFIPVVRAIEVIVWKPRSAGGGIVNREPLTMDMEDWAKANKFNLDTEKYEFKDSNGNEAIETWQYYGLVLTDDDVYPAFLPMKKSNLKVARKWNTKMKKLKLPSRKNAPLFYSSWLIGSFLDSGNGNEWYNFTVGQGPLVMELPQAQDVFEASVSLKEIIEEGGYTADLGENEVPSDDDAI